MFEIVELYCASFAYDFPTTSSLAPKSTQYFQTDSDVEACAPGAQGSSPLPSKMKAGLPGRLCRTQALSLRLWIDSIQNPMPEAVHDLDGFGNCFQWYRFASHLGLSFANKEFIGIHAITLLGLIFIVLICQISLGRNLLWPFWFVFC